MEGPEFSPRQYGKRRGTEATLVERSLISSACHPSLIGLRSWCQAIENRRRGSFENVDLVLIHGRSSPLPPEKGENEAICDCIHPLARGWVSTQVQDNTRTVWTCKTRAELLLRLCRSMEYAESSGWQRHCIAGVARIVVTYARADAPASSHVRLFTGTAAPQDVFTKLAEPSSGWGGAGRWW